MEKHPSKKVISEDQVQSIVKDDNIEEEETFELPLNRIKRLMQVINAQTIRGDSVKALARATVTPT
jgi:hypothetical protein